MGLLEYLTYLVPITRKGVVGFGKHAPSLAALYGRCCSPCAGLRAHERGLFQVWLGWAGWLCRASVGGPKSPHVAAPRSDLTCQALQ